MTTKSRIKNETPVPIPMLKPVELMSKVTDASIDLIAQISEYIGAISAWQDMDTNPMLQIMEQLGLKNRASFRKLYLLPALEQSLIEMEYPQNPNSSKQRY